MKTEETETIKWILSELANFESEDIESNDIEIYGEDEQGRDGVCTIEITSIANRAERLISELEAKLAEHEWISIEDKLPDSEPVYFYHKDWIDEDFNPKGQREGFYNPNGDPDDWTSAKWIPDQDCYTTAYDVPTHWCKQC